MDRDNIFQYWFNRAISPNIQNSTNPAPEDDDDGDSDDVDGNTDFGYGGGQTDHAPHRKQSTATSHDDYATWCLMRSDNVRFWDCFGLMRSDITLSSRAAARTVSLTPDIEYFPHELKTGYAFYFRGNVEMLEVELLRLEVENPRLHAVLWVLLDNPNLQVDSVIGAIFRLNDVQFKQKFQFEYEPGCFSGKGAILSFGDKFSNPSTPHTRCRSSTPSGSRQAVSRRSSSLRGRNMSGNRKSPKTVREPSRKPRSLLMMTALLRGIGHTSSLNSSRNSSFRGLDEDYSDEDDDDLEEDDGDDNDADVDGDIDLQFFQANTTQNNNNERGMIPSYFEIISGRNKRNQLKKQLSVNENFPSLPNGDSSLKAMKASRGLLQGTDENNSKTNNAEVVKGMSVIRFGGIKQRRGKKHDPTCGFSVKSLPLYEVKRSKYNLTILPSGTTINNTQQTERSPGQIGATHEKIVHFDASPTKKPDPTQKIHFSDNPTKSFNLSTPYPITRNEIATDFIHRQACLAGKVMLSSTQRKCDMKFCLPSSAIPASTKVTQGQGQYKEHKSNKLKIRIQGTPVNIHHPPNVKAKEEELVNDCIQEDCDVGTLQLPRIQKRLRDCGPKNVCAERIKAIKSLGGYHYVKPLLKMVKRSVHCSSL